MLRAAYNTRTAKPSKSKVKRLFLAAHGTLTVLAPCFLQRIRGTEQCRFDFHGLYADSNITVRLIELVQGFSHSSTKSP